MFAVGAVTGLAGDATHVASGTTHYEWDGFPTLWRSALWFPAMVGLAVLGAAWFAEREGGRPVNRRTRLDLITGAGLVLALYGLTAALRGQAETVSVVTTAALAVAIWSWWDPSPGALRVALGAAVLGPLAEIGVVAVGAASYAEDADSLGGVPLWLPSLYFAAGAVASRMWAAVQRDGEDGP